MARIFKSTKAKIGFSLAAILLALYFGMGLWSVDSAAFLGGPEWIRDWMGSDGAGAPQTGDAPTSGMMVGKNAIVATDQRPGSEITIAQAYLEKPGYVVIHADAAGKPGAIIGSSAYLSGYQNDKIKVKLSRAVKDGEKLHAMVHAEMSGNKTFEAASDAPISENGGPVYGIFEVRADADTNVEVTL